MMTTILHITIMAGVVFEITAYINIIQHEEQPRANTSHQQPAAANVDLSF